MLISCYFISLFPANIPPFFLPVLFRLDAVLFGSNAAMTDRRMFFSLSLHRVPRRTKWNNSWTICGSWGLGDTRTSFPAVSVGGVVVSVSEWLLGCDCNAPSLLREAFYGMQRDRSPCIYSSFQSRGRGVASRDDCQKRPKERTLLCSAAPFNCSQNSEMTLLVVRLTLCHVWPSLSPHDLSV